MRIDPSHFLSPESVARNIREALELKRPFALVRVGDGEALAMAQDTVLPLDEIKKQGFLRYAGISVPDLKARDELLTMLPRADLVGLPQRWDLPYFAPLVEQILERHNLALRNVCDCCINYALHQAGLLLPLLAGRRILLIGRRSRELAGILQQYYQIRTVGRLIIDNYRQVPQILQLCRNYQFDIAFVAAGIPAVTLCVKIASHLGKVALDLGHLADRIIEEYL
ncbi:hypothetical protein EDC14_103624 [Hydrogenispora ethanolica]|jgi:hypothetical protein|uniref:GT-D fold-like domain-containing protein n=1 Tax=Hydrogenispora ethanolica TaxID=1082276 RepID=A0A4R1R461_HYDET|nr:GT-D fold domain-containing glycosyltransferase [Hydrogenispora ethanolica]TCL60271.1 hypothetical protein EDC14_103624 [Hydrogenispora ethanolica]